MEVLSIYLCALTPDIHGAWQTAFTDPRISETLAALGLKWNIEVVNRDILDLCKERKVQALVSPANSFGNMNGGIDGYYLRTLGEELETNVRQSINKQFHGLLPVGSALIAKMPKKAAEAGFALQYLIAAPTMILPTDVASTINAFLAFKATLEIIEKFNQRYEERITSVAVPGLCTGVGGMPPFRMALQMRAALDSFLYRGFSLLDFKVAREKYVELATITYPFDVSKLYGWRTEKSQFDKMRDESK